MKKKSLTDSSRNSVRVLVVDSNADRALPAGPFVTVVPPLWPIAPMSINRLVIRGSAPMGYAMSRWLLRIQDDDCEVLDERRF